MYNLLVKFWSWLQSTFSEENKKKESGENTVINDLYFELSKIHDRVHRGFRYKHDIHNYGVDEDWRFPVDPDNVVDDCDGFAIACRMLVKEMDPDLETRLVACQTETGEWHAVCAVGNYILENRYYRVMTKEELIKEGYKFHYVSGLNPGDDWYKLEESDA